MKKRFLSILLAAVMVLSLIPATVFAADYTDTQGHWGEKAIDRWSSYDIVSGKGNGNFDPDGFMTRGEAAKVFANLFKLETKADLSGYTDVGLGGWYDDSIAKCINAGIMEGYGDGIINPTGTITREMFFVMFCRALGIKPVDTTEININDASNVSNYAKGYITALVNKGYISGITETENGITVAPKFNINRASVMSLMDQTITTYVNTTEKVIAKDGLTLIVVDNANVTFANNTKDAEVYVFGKNTAITNAPVGTKVITSENASGTKVNGKSFNKDTTAIVEKPTPSDDESYTPPTPTKYTVTGVTLDQTEVTIVVGDADVKLTATVLPDNATNKNVTWSSSNESVATVSNGTVLAIAAGTATITVTTVDGGKTATCNMKVVAPEKYTVTFDMQGHGTTPTNLPVNEGEKITKPADPTATDLVFVGWYTEASCTNLWNFATDKVTGDITLYAKWIENVYTMKKGTDWFAAFAPTFTDTDKAKVTDITFIKELPSSVQVGDITTSTNLAADGSDHVKGYLVKNGVTDTYTIYVVGKYILGNENCQLMFHNFKNLANIDLSNFDTSKVTNMQGMFHSCTGLTNLKISNFNTYNVTTMESMFSGCTGLTSLTLSDFSNEKVTSMCNMFKGCSMLESLYLSNFNTIEVTNMVGMFSGCSKLATLNLSEFNTSKVEKMGTMFKDCSGLTSLDLSKLNSSKVTDMNEMFYDCSNLETIVFGDNFDTSNVTNMKSMFYGCSKLASLDLSNFNSIEVTNMVCMFRGCSKLASLDLSEFNTSKVENMSEMFKDCSSLETIVFGGNFDTSKVTDMNTMFNGCSKLASLDLSNFNTIGVTSMADMFSGCSKLASLDLSEFNTSKVGDMSEMFSGCSGLTSLDLGKFSTSMLYNMNSMFKDCLKLISLDLSEFDTSKIKADYYMLSVFTNCSKLTRVRINVENSNIKGLLEQLADGWTYDTVERAYKRTVE